MRAIHRSGTNNDDAIAAYLFMNPRPLLVRFGALGDMVILTVAIQALHERCGHPVDIIASGPWTIPLLQDQPGVGEIHIVRSRTTPYLLSFDQQRLVRTLRLRGRGPTWIGETNDSKAMWLLNRAGWKEKDFCGVRQLPSAPEHYCDHLLRLANLTPASALLQHQVSRQRPHYSLQVPTAAQRAADAWLATHDLKQRPLILIQAGNKRTMKRFGTRQRITNTKYWPEQNWAEVLKVLRAMHPDHAILLLGVPQEAALNDDILQLAQIGHAHNIARDNSILLLMALASRAQGMISVDTGPGHVAAAVGCRVVTLFGTTDPAFYVPRGPAHDAIPVTGHVGDQQLMLGITPSQVIAAWQQLLHRH